MSELKAIRGGDIHDDVIFSYNSDSEDRADVLYYLKSEADKVIAKLKDKLQNVSELLNETREWLIESQKLHKRCADNASKVIRHHKYKRCLAMAKWCHNQREIYERDSYNWELEDDAVNSLRNKANIMRKWRKRWLELAEKFKPNNEVNNG